MSTKVQSGVTGDIMLVAAAAGCGAVWSDHV